MKSLEKLKSALSSPKEVVRVRRLLCTLAVLHKIIGLIQTSAQAMYDVHSPNVYGEMMLRNKMAAYLKHQADKSKLVQLTSLPFSDVTGHAKTCSAVGHAQTCP